MEASVEVEQVGEDTASYSTNGALRDIGKDGVAELRENPGAYSSETV
jgi:hypothetical protein